MRLAVTRLEHGHRRLVGVQHRVAAQLCAECIHQRLQLRPALAHPLRQSRARDQHPCTLEDALLTVQRQVVHKLGHQHMGQQPGRGDALVDDVRCYWRLYELLALGARPLASYVALYREHAGLVVQLLGHVLTDTLHLTATAAHRAVGLVGDLYARQVGRQRFALGLGLGLAVLASAVALQLLDLG